LTGENRRTRRKTCPSATLSTTNPTWIDLGANPGLRGERPATNHLRHGTAPRYFILLEERRILYNYCGKVVAQECRHFLPFNYEGCPESNALCFSAVNIYLKIMKITHTQVRRFVSEPYFSTKSPSTSTALRQRETSACMPCRYHSMSCSFVSRSK